MPSQPGLEVIVFIATLNMGLSGTVKALLWCPIRSPARQHGYFILTACMTVIPELPQVTGPGVTEAAQRINAVLISTNRHVNILTTLTHDNLAAVRPRRLGVALQTPGHIG